MRYFGISYYLITTHFVLESKLLIELLHLIEYLVIVFIASKLKIEERILTRIQLVDLLDTQT